MKPSDGKKTNGSQEPAPQYAGNLHKYKFQTDNSLDASRPCEMANEAATILEERHNPPLEPVLNPARRKHNQDLCHPEI